MFKSIAICCALASAAAPVAADQITLRVDPRTAEEARAIRLGLALYGLHRDIEGGAGVTQDGIRNLARLHQSGHGQFGVIDQRGDDHAASLRQTGDGQSYGIFQRGTGTSARVRQTGTGRTGLLFQYGW